MKIFNTENGWMNENLMIKYLTELIIPECKCEHSILIVDSFDGHFSKVVRDFLKEVPFLHLFIIPGGITSVAQPCDVGVNAPFKSIIKNNPWSSQTTSSRQMQRI
jgi:hypothetical protein